jgi:hypothetical protein
LLIYGFGNQEDLKSELKGECELDRCGEVHGNKVDATTNGEDANGWIVTQEKAYEIG